MRAGTSQATCKHVCELLPPQGEGGRGGGGCSQAGAGGSTEAGAYSAGNSWAILLFAGKHAAMPAQPQFLQQRINGTRTHCGQT